MLEFFERYYPKLGDKAWVHSRAIVIGQVLLGDNASVWPGAVIRGDVNEIKIGERTNVQDNTVIHATHVSHYNEKGYSTIVGDDVTIGHQAILHGCSVGDRVMVGMGATVLDGAVIPSDTIIGANSLVPMNKQLESGYLYLGSPAKAVRLLSEEEKAFLVYSASHYVKLKDKYMGAF